MVILAYLAGNNVQHNFIERLRRRLRPFSRRSQAARAVDTGAPSVSRMRRRSMFSRQSSPRMSMQLIGAAGVAAAVAGGGAALAANLVEPPVFASQNGVLDILVIAKAKPIPTISFRPPHS